MRIIKLSASNVKRLSAVEITPEGSLIKIGGKNGAGKSSVLDSIAYALGGKDLVPPEPIRKGEAEAKIVVDLGDYVVTRKFTREMLLLCKADSETPHVHSDACPKGWGETRSTVTVTNKDGAKYPSPQALLDSLYGRLSFDPLQFANADAKEQDETLRRIVKLDFKDLNAVRKEAYDRRAMTKKSVTTVHANLLQLEKFPDVPAEEISIEEISKEIQRGHELQLIAEEANKAVDKAQHSVFAVAKSKTDAGAKVESLEQQIEQLQKRLNDARVEVQKFESDLTVENKKAEAFVVAFEEAKRAVPNFQDLDARLREVDSTNQKVRKNAEYTKTETRLAMLRKEVEDDDLIIEGIDQKKADALQAAEFPVPGLGLHDEGVTFNGVPFEQASNAAQIAVSVAIGLALNPKLKVLLIRNGNGLDSDGVKAIQAQAEKADAQLWMEWVAETKDGVSVMLEEGHTV